MLTPVGLASECCAHNKDIARSDTSILQPCDNGSPPPPPPPPTFRDQILLSYNTSPHTIDVNTAGAAPTPTAASATLPDSTVNLDDSYENNSQSSGATTNTAPDEDDDSERLEAETETAVTERINMHNKPFLALDFSKSMSLLPTSSPPPTISPIVSPIVSPTPQQSNNCERHRRSTFESIHWTAPFLDTAKMAQTGFYYLGRDDQVACAFCQVQIQKWDLDDDPLAEHQRWSPSCPLLSRYSTANIPINAEELDEILPPLSYDHCGRLNIRTAVDKNCPTRPPKQMVLANLMPASPIDDEMAALCHACHNAPICIALLPCWHGVCEHCSIVAEAKCPMCQNVVRFRGALSFQ